MVLTFKRILPFLLALGILFIGVALAQARSPRSFRLPVGATQISDSLYYLGKSATGAQGYAFVRRAGGFAKPEGKGGGAKAPKCYGFIASGARWKTTESYVTDIENSATETSLETWDTQVAFDVFGSRDLSSVVDGADTSSPDGKNELYYGAIDNPGVIGVTIVWGYFYGRPQTRRLIEWDMILDNADFSWGDAALDPTVMDYQNILTHELGHSAGMADLYETSCAEETMYGYATEGETKKRDLNSGDITGIKALYR